MSKISVAAIPHTVQADICAMAIMRAAAAMQTPEGREAIERGKEKYLRHLAEMKGDETRK